MTISGGGKGDQLFHASKGLTFTLETIRQFERQKALAFKDYLAWQTFNEAEAQAYFIFKKTVESISEKMEHDLKEATTHYQIKVDDAFRHAKQFDRPDFSPNELNPEWSHPDEMESNDNAC